MVGFLKGRGVYIHLCFAIWKAAALREQQRSYKLMNVTFNTSIGPADHISFKFASNTESPLMYTDKAPAELAGFCSSQSFVPDVCWTKQLDLFSFLFNECGKIFNSTASYFFCEEMQIIKISWCVYRGPIRQSRCGVCRGGNQLIGTSWICCQLSNREENLRVEMRKLATSCCCPDLPLPKKYQTSQSEYKTCW